MKIRSVKLREAHKSDNGVASFCSILWGLQAQHIVTSSSSDTSICIHDPLLLSAPPRALRHHRDGVTALALSPNSTCLASGSIDHSVKLYKFPGGEFQTNITRFTLPIRVLAFNKSGSMLAAAGDDEGIKLINTIDGSIARVLKGHKGSVTGLAFDPKSEYLASIDSVGTVIYWELQSGKELHTLKGIAPDTGLDFSIMNVLCWSPDGETLAVPGLKNDVIMYDRDTAEKLFALRGDHVQRICFLSWSPNGKYMVTSGLDKQVLVWDVDQKLDIDRQKFADVICCMAWKPTGNALAVIDAMGKYGIWESVVPSSMKSPTEGIPSAQSKNNNGLLFFDEEDEEEEGGLNISGSLSDFHEDSIGESEPTSRKRLRKRSAYDDDSEEEVNNGFSLLPKVESRKKPSHGQKERLDNGKGVKRSSIISGGSKIQEAFQPGSTPVQPGKRRFLCYNMLGTISTMEQDGYSHIEIDFHDTGSGPRVPAMTDHFGFTMAALCENGSVFANPCKGEKNMSTLMYRPFSSWANNSEWSMRFEEEEVKVVALGTSWVAAITSLNFLRIFSEGGLQKNVISLEGPVVTASGFRDELAVVTHASPSLPSNDQMLEFRVFNICNGTQPIRGRLPLTPGSYLTWFGFSDEGQICSFDSKGVLRVYMDQYGGSWLPLFSSGKVKKPEENYWIVGLNAYKLFCVVCKSPDSFPQVIPKPILTLFDFSLPLASSDLGADNLENEFILNNLHLSQINKMIEETVAIGQDTTSLDDEAFNTEAALDKCILKLIASCCNGDKLVRATELVKLLTLEKSVKGAIKLVTTLKLPNLAERFNSILEERLLNENTVPTAMLLTNSHTYTTVKPDTLVNKPFTLMESRKTSEPAIPSTSQMLSSPSSIKKETPESAKPGKVNLEHKKSAKLENTGVVKNEGELKTEVKKEAVKKVTEVNQALRPSNPFAKPSKSQEKYSLFESLTRMKNEAQVRKDA
ncbi:WD repeat and HMG-box DNA-binding protein like [Actinidia chinensis var. chinensis]|uniref:WD repeat and HMG-box DNA-binding protein like n=1 Tax=Actinidia chinensis var. chinensis TaxID=1590841 RepID=A0A2R6QI85_ACTCC|nr:WD repeat and HMG-box DNA-binding protein like [Actinidia chinensis var. chinensis]